MPTPINRFKQRLKAKQTQLGIWASFANHIAAEVISTTGYDFMVIDGEHAPNTIATIADQLRVIAGSPTDAVVRIAVDESWMVKQVLDTGAQSILVPMIETAQQAHDMAQAMLYPPKGKRGAGASAARAAAFGSISDYLLTANAQTSLLLQVESVAGIENLDDILAVDNIDGIFIGPSDLSADMGYPGQTEHPEVIRVIENAIKRITAADRAAGILTTNPDKVPHYAKLGVNFIACAMDIPLLVNAARNHIQAMRAKL